MLKKNSLWIFLLFLFLFSFVVACNDDNEAKDGSITIQVETSMTVGETQTIQYSLKDIESSISLNWTVSDPTVIELDVDGLVITALKAGMSTITVTAEGLTTNSVEITVNEPEKETYTITYNLNGGSWAGAAGVSSFIEGQFPTLGTPKKDGYEFLGWYEGTTKVSNITENKNYALEAKWEEIIETYTISYELDGGKWGSQKGATKFNEDQFPSLVEPIKKGYVFLGWYENDVLVSAISENKNYSLIAKWEEINYTISYELDGGTYENAPDKIKNGETIELGTPIKEGYTFLGWKTTVDDDNLSWSISNVVSDVVLYAVWGNEGLYVGSKMPYKTVSEALAAAQAGDKIVLLPGTYEGLTIDKSITVKSYYFSKNLTETEDTYRVIFTSDLVFACDNITLNGVTLTGNAKICNEKGKSIANPTILNTYFRETTVNKNSSDPKSTAPFLFTNTNGYEITNLKISNCRIDQATGRAMIAFLSQINGLTIENSEFYGGFTVSTFNDGIKVDNSTEFGVKGDVTIKGNRFENYSQYVIWFLSYGAGNYVLENNKFVSIGQTAASHAMVNFISSVAPATEKVDITVKYNEINGGYILFRMDNKGTVPTNDNGTITLNYNIMNNCKGTTYVLNSSTIAPNVDKNYWGSATLDSAKFVGATVPTDYYTTSSDVPTKGKAENLSFAISYELNGGTWDTDPYTFEEISADLLADLSTYYGTQVTKSNVHTVSENATQKLYKFFWTDATYSEKWAWLRDYMIYCRENDLEKSSGATYLKTTNDDV